MLNIGLDVSGNQSEGNYLYMGIVIGTDNEVDRIMNHLDSVVGSDRWVKTTRFRRRLVRNMVFDKKNIIGFCIKLSMNKIVRDVNSSMRGRHERISSRIIFRTYNRLLWKIIQVKILEFVNRHNHSIDDVSFQCDSDCVDFLKDNGLHRTDAGDAYTLSDLVAWANNNDRHDHPGVVSLRLPGTFTSKLKKKLKK